MFTRILDVKGINWAGLVNQASLVSRFILFFSDSIHCMVSEPARFAGISVVATRACPVNRAENFHVIVSSRQGGLKIVMHEYSFRLRIYGHSSPRDSPFTSV